jgi:hypothetical protein
VFIVDKGETMIAAMLLVGFVTLQLCAAVSLFFPQRYSPIPSHLPARYPLPLSLLQRLYYKFRSRRSYLVLEDQVSAELTTDLDLAIRNSSSPIGSFGYRHSQTLCREWQTNC